MASMQIPPPADGQQTILVVGLSMVGWRFCEAVRELGALAGEHKFRIVTFCEEPRLAYNRVGLTQMFAHGDADQLLMTPDGWYEDEGICVLRGHRAISIDRAKQTVCSDKGVEVHYDKLVLATGSTAWVPPITGTEAVDGQLSAASPTGLCVYRTIEDVQTIMEKCQNKCKAAVIIGGGLLGLEAAKACYDMAVPEVHVLQNSSRLMSRQLDQAGGDLLKRKIEELAQAPQSIHVHCSSQTKQITVNDEGEVCGVLLKDDVQIECQLVIICTGIRPRDELGRQCGLEVGDRGGIVVDDSLQTSDPAVFAIGEVALHRGMCYGLVAPGYDMAAVLAKKLVGDSLASFDGGDFSAKLKLMGVDVASFGIYEGHQLFATAVPFSYYDPFKGVYKKLLFSSEGNKLLGGMLVGDTSDYGKLMMMAKNDTDLDCEPDELVHGRKAPSSGGAAELDANTQVCSCNNVTRGAITAAIRADDMTEVGQISACTKAGKGCGGCLPMVKNILTYELQKRGATVKEGICEHFPFSRRELVEIIKVKELKTFDEVLADSGCRNGAKNSGGYGCEICKPCLAGIFASLWNEPVHKPEHRTLQDTNDRFLGNIQRGGSYSVVPRVPGGEITPDKLIALGQVAKNYGLYTKITGAQRVDMFGAPVNELPNIWKDLVDAGFESGHAYGKALRTVKSCVGSTWCRYGIGDSVGFAVRLEERYRGIRAPHKLKGGVSGCIRECAEAQGKDFGLIAVQGGYNVYVCGNGGAKPRHATLLAAAVDEATAQLYCDRFLMYYLLTASKLQRTARWLEAMDGGIEFLKQVVVEDKLGICAELDARMQSLVNTYECEWKAVVNDPVRVKSFQQFANTSETESGIEWMEERGQRRPVDWQSAASRQPWKARHIPLEEVHTHAKQNIELEEQKRTIELEDENGCSTRDWIVRWIEVGNVADWPEIDGGHAVKYGNSQLAVYNFSSRNEWYAAQNMSPDTRTFAMSRGMIGDKGGIPHVADPVLKKTYSLSTGECLSDPNAFHLLTFRARAEDGKVFVELPPESELDDILSTKKRQIKGDEEKDVRPGSAGSSECACGDKAMEW